jgi:quinolinate synthase
MELNYSDAIRERTAPIYQRVKRVIPEVEWPVHAPWVDAINALKRERDAVILAHNYQTPQIFHGVADHVGDSLELARIAADIDAEVIVMAGVRFMAETVKLLAPERTVLLPSKAAGCSLAESITPAQVRHLRREHPGVPVVAYVNTTASVKAEADICCTSSNAVKVVESLGCDRVIMVPDAALADWVAKSTGVEIIAWRGECDVHTRFTANDVCAVRAQYPGVRVLAHPECTSEVLEEADFVGSTSQMVSFVHRERPPEVMLVTECSMSDNVAVACPTVSFVRPCNLCSYMKSITLECIHHTLDAMSPEVHLGMATAIQARRSLERMLEV